MTEIGPKPDPQDGIRILFFTHALEPTGAPLCLRDLVRALARKPGVSCSVISSEDGPLHKDLERAGVSVHVTTPFPWHDRAAFEGRLVELSGLVEAGGYEVAVVNSMASFAAVHVAHRAKVPAAWIIHEGFTPRQFLSAFFPPPGPPPPVRRRLFEAFDLASATIFQAEETRGSYLSSVKPRVSATMPYGIDLRAIDAFRRETGRKDLRAGLGLPDPSTVVLSPGRLEPRRSQTLLLQALQVLLPDHPDLFLVLLGDAGGAYSRAVADYVLAAELENHTLVVPEQRETFEWYACADVVVSLSDVGSLPRSVLEGLAFDARVASSAVGGIPALLSDAGDGALCQPNDLGSTIEALKRSAVNARPRNREAAMRVRERHDLQSYTDRCLELVRELAAGHSLTEARLTEIAEG